MSWLIDQLCQVILNLVVGVCGFFVQSIVQPLGLSPSVFLYYFPTAEKYITVFKACSLIILAFIVAIQSWRIATRNDQLGETDSPLTLGIRTIFAIVLIFSSITVMSTFVSTANKMFTDIQLDNNTNAFAISTDTDSNNVLSKGYLNLAKQITAPSEDDAVEAALEVALSAFSGIASIMAVMSIIYALIKIVIIGLISYKLIMFLLEILERYVLLMIIVITSPLIWCTTVSKSTINIFKSWFQLFISSLILCFLNMFFLRIIMEGMEMIFSTTAIENVNWQPNAVLGSFIVLALIRAAQMADNHLGRIMTTASTGGGLGQEILGSAFMLGNMARGAAHVGSNIAGIPGKIAGKTSSFDSPTPQKYTGDKNPKTLASEANRMKLENRAINDKAVADRQAIDGSAPKNVVKSNYQSAAMNNDATMGKFKSTLAAADTASAKAEAYKADPKYNDENKKVSGKLQALEKAETEKSLKYSNQAVQSLDSDHTKLALENAASYGLSDQTQEKLAEHLYRQNFKDIDGYTPQYNQLEMTDMDTGHFSIPVLKDGSDTPITLYSNGYDADGCATTMRGGQSFTYDCADPELADNFFAAQLGTTDIDFNMAKSPERAAQLIEGYGFNQGVLEEATMGNVTGMEGMEDGSIRIINPHGAHASTLVPVMTADEMSTVTPDMTTIVGKLNGRNVTYLVENEFSDIGYTKTTIDAVAVAEEAAAANRRPRR